MLAHATSLLLCLTLCNPVDCNPSGFPVHGILQARILQWIALSSSRGLPNPRIEPASHESQALVGRFYTMSTTWEVPGHKILIAQSEGIFSLFSKILDFAFPPAVILMVTIWNTLFCVPWGHWVIKLEFESIEWRSVGRLLLWDVSSYSSSSSGA